MSWWWSSTENNSNNAWLVNFNDGSRPAWNKNNSNYVRPVLAFKLQVSGVRIDAIKIASREQVFNKKGLSAMCALLSFRDNGI